MASYPARNPSSSAARWSAWPAARPCGAGRFCPAALATGPRSSRIPSVPAASQRSPSLGYEPPSPPPSAEMSMAPFSPISKLGSRQVRYTEEARASAAGSEPQVTAAGRPEWSRVSASTRTGWSPQAMTFS